MKQITKEELFALFDASVHDKLEEAWANSEAVVVFENVDLCSSRLGERTALRIGQQYTYKSVDETKGRHLYDLPSMRQYAQSFCKGAV